MSLIDFAKSELARIGLGEGASGDLDQAMRDHIITMVTVFADAGHSGMSAGYALDILKRLLAQEPLTPLTGEEDEWYEVADFLWQNKRCSRVFKDKNRFGGQAYDIEGKVFVEQSGIGFTNLFSLTPITFPYTPKTKYVPVKPDDGAVMGE